MVVKKSIVPVERIEKSILLIRSQKVMLDTDLAQLYGVKTKELNKAVKRNIDRFPDDFMFQLTKKEHDNLRFHFGTSSSSGGRQYRPYVFTEQGVAMLSSVLRSKRAVQVNVQIMRTFVKLREIISSNIELAHKLEELERKYDAHDEQIKAVFDAIKQMMAPVKKKKNPIGFKASENQKILEDKTLVRSPHIN